MKVVFDILYPLQDYIFLCIHAIPNPFNREVKEIHVQRCTKKQMNIKQSLTLEHFMFNNK